MFYKDAVKSLTENTDINSMSEGELKVTEPCVCESAAGFYIGEWCIEKTDNFLLPQPYQRLSDYMTKELAEQSLHLYQ
jgi:hypothetical protein